MDLSLELPLLPACEVWPEDVDPWLAPLDDDEPLDDELDDDDEPADEDVPVDVDVPADDDEPVDVDVPLDGASEADVPAEVLPPVGVVSLLGGTDFGAWVSTDGLGAVCELGTVCVPTFG